MQKILCLGEEVAAVEFYQVEPIQTDNYYQLHKSSGKKLHKSEE
jgi:hypothetical protein